MQISKNGLVVHLSENQRFKTGVIVFVKTKGIKAFRDSLLIHSSEAEIPEIIANQE